jgi:hypothetical protein
VILAAGLLVLLGLGLFVAGILTGVTALYWGCVAACVVAAVLLFLARRQLTPPGATATGPAGTDAPAARTAADTSPARAPESPTGAATEARPATATAPSAAATAPSGAAAAPVVQPPARTGPRGDPPIEEVEVTDLLMVVDLKDEVLVVDEHPRYHLEGCAHLTGRATIPLPLDEARADGFTPCAVCTPDRTLADRARGRRAAGSS